MAVAFDGFAKGQAIEVTPPALRHTFTQTPVDAKGVQYAKEASGRRSLKYVWWYFRLDEQSLANTVDDLD